MEREVVERALRTLQHRIGKGWCPHCQKVVRAPTPNLLPRAAHGPRAHASLPSLRAEQGATIGNLETFAATVWNHPLGGGQITAMLERVTVALLPTFDRLMKQLATEAVLFSGTTSWRVDGERAVLWVFTNRRLTVFWIDPSGTGWVPRTVVGATVEGAVVTDGAEVWLRVETSGRQGCLAHPFREARDLMRVHGNVPEIAQMMPELMERLGWLMALDARRDRLAASTLATYQWLARTTLLQLAGMLTPRVMVVEVGHRDNRRRPVDARRSGRRRRVSLGPPRG